MEAPFGIAFLKKAELYNLICRFDKQYNGSSKDNPWLIERQILRWTYNHHKHLGSPIDTNHLSRDKQWSKLKEFGMLNRKGELKPQFIYLKKGHLTKVLENLVVRGFATYFDIEHGHNAIIINKEGLLVGEVIADMEKDSPIIKFNYLFYSNIMDHFGAFLLLIITLLSLLKIFGVLN